MVSIVIPLQITNKKRKFLVAVKYIISNKQIKIQYEITLAQTISDSINRMILLTIRVFLNYLQQMRPI
jgi:hypothetical protein